MSSLYTRGQIAACIDHTLLKATATAKAVEELCMEAKKHGFFSVCINPVWVSLASSLLAGSQVAVCTVVGFPLGANASASKAAETSLAVREGAVEIDMVINIGAAKAGDWTSVESDIRAVVEAARANPSVLVKVIIETCYLSDSEKVKACEAAIRAGARFVKTSTGFGTGGATVEDVRLMKKTVESAGLLVKASGGIRSLSDTIAMIEAGADRIGASAGIAILSELP